MNDLQCCVENGVMRLVLSCPSKGNALTPDMVDALIVAMDTIQGSPISRVVITSLGRHFCTGFDLSEVDSLSDGDLLHRFIRIETALQAIRHAPCPTVVYAQGAAFGAGADLFAACQYRFASANTNFAFPGPNFGLVLGTGRLSQLLGGDAALALIARNEPIDGATALELGLASELVNDDDGEFDAMKVACNPFTRTTSAMLRASAIQDTRDRDMAMLVRSASTPGLKERLLSYRAAVRKSKGKQQ